MTAEASEPVWSVPGFDVVEMLGFGATGEVWLAHEAATGEMVALKRLRTPRDLAARDRLRREAAALACVDHPHVVRLRRLVSAGDELVLVLDHAAGGSLASLIAARRLDAAEVVTVGVPLAEALAAVHARGLVHGDVTPANVLFTQDGLPMLSDLGVCRLVGEQSRWPDVVVGTPGFLDPAVLSGAPPGPAADVHGLAAVCFAALTGRAPYDASGARLPLLHGMEPGRPMPPTLAAAIETALDPEPAHRPTAMELAAAVYDACPARPVALATGPRGDEWPERGASPFGSPPVVADLAPLTHDLRIRQAQSPVPSPEEATRRRRHRRGPGRVRPTPRILSWRAAAVTLMVVCALSMAVFSGLLWAGTDGRGSATAVRPAHKPVPRVDWLAVLSDLDQARSLAFAAGDPTRLADVYAPDGPALARDLELLDRLRATGHTARGVQLVPRSIKVAESSETRMVLRVVDVMPPYELVTFDGDVTSTRPGRPATAWSVTLVREGSAWQMYDVRRG